MSLFGGVDIVVGLQVHNLWWKTYLFQVPNAGVAEIGRFDTMKWSNGKPIKPTTKTLDINLLGVLYSMYFKRLTKVNISKHCGCNRKPFT
jgi:hypothetical protein